MLSHSHSQCFLFLLIYISTGGVVVSDELHITILRLAMKTVMTILFLSLVVVVVVYGQPLVPAIITFGDSVADVGNNDHLPTIFKANYPPYGRDFANHEATGRFSNGKLATDITAETLGFTGYPPAYLSPQASGKNLLIGANFASAASGYYDKTAYLYHAVPLTQQVEYFKEYRSKLAHVAGKKKASSIISEALYLLATGSGDFVQNYYINPDLHKVYSPDDFSSSLISFFSTFVKNIYELGARKLGVTSLPPLGCLPAAITRFGYGKNECVLRLNHDAQSFNKKLNDTAKSLMKKYPKLKIVVFNIYQPLYDLATKPFDHGFFEGRRGCCGTGTVETSLALCNPKSVGTCANATGYVFWDGVHPTESANQVIADSLLLQGVDLVS